jgi:putative transposase
MKRSRFTEKQIIGVLKEHQAGLSAAELCRKHGISDATFYNWRSKYGGMEVSEAKRLKQLRDELEAAERVAAKYPELADSSLRKRDAMAEEIQKLEKGA